MLDSPRLIEEDSSLETKNRFTFLITIVSMVMVGIFLGLYLFFVRSAFVIGTTLVSLAAFAAVLLLLKKAWFQTAKLLLLLGFAMQESLAVFSWFPKEADLDLFYFVIAPITFFIYDFAVRREKYALVAANVVAIGLLLLSKILPLNNPLIPLSENALILFRIVSVVGATGSIGVVFYFYASNLARTHRDLRTLAATDSLTRIFNRRALFNEGARLLALNQRQNSRLSMLLIDIDHFKNVNDLHGHPTGDETLIQIAELIASMTRQSDALCRYGGEEFALVLPDTAEEDATMVAENLRRVVEKHTFSGTGALPLRLTVSIGVVCATDPDEDFDRLMQRADKALYRAKREGRNRVVAD